MKTIATTIISCLTFTACGTGIIEGVPIANKSWKLETNANDALVDPQHAEFGTYPNPRGVKWMKIVLEDDGQLCADDGQRSWCGGPLQGIPYVTVLNMKEDSYCVRVLDIFGNHVRTGCEQGAPPNTLQGTQDDVQTLAQDDAQRGSVLLINAVNAGLEKMGLEIRLALPEKAGLEDFDQGDITISSGTCADVLEYLDDEFSDDHPGTDDYLYGPEAMAECLDQGRCRIGQLITRAMADACAAMPEGADSERVTSGIVGAGGYAVDQLCSDKYGEIDTCVGSPLVLDLGRNGLQLKGLAAGAQFPLMGENKQAVGWLAGSDDALLAIDLDHDGVINSGRELFGEASSGWAANGFAALARYDENGDGVISAEDSVYERLLAWRDDGDGRSQPHELLPLSQVGVSSIGLKYLRKDVVDAFGNELRLHGKAIGADGKSVPVIDVWFRMKAPLR